MYSTTAFQDFVIWCPHGNLEQRAFVLRHPGRCFLFHHKDRNLSIQWKEINPYKGAVFI
jgi:hypothetical protein